MKNAGAGLLFGAWLHTAAAAIPLARAAGGCGPGDIFVPVRRHDYLLQRRNGTAAMRRFLAGELASMPISQHPVTNALTGHADASDVSSTAKLLAYGARYSMYNAPILPTLHWDFTPAFACRDAGDTVKNVTSRLSNCAHAPL